MFVKLSRESEKTLRFCLLIFFCDFVLGDLAKVFVLIEFPDFLCLNGLICVNEPIKKKKEAEVQMSKKQKRETSDQRY